MNEINGDLIVLAKEKKFDVIAHGCNCMCKMGRGLAPQMDNAFGCGSFSLEAPRYQGDINKLGQIDYQRVNGVYIVNAYTQYSWDTSTKPLDYEALTLCLRKMNKKFSGQHIGLPQIGCHLAGGDWNVVKEIIRKELKDCTVTIVNYAP